MATKCLTCHSMDGLQDGAYAYLKVSLPLVLPKGEAVLFLQPGPVSPVLQQFSEAKS